jgi:glutathione S-transferase
MNEPKIILHQYDISPSAGKVRTVLGIKQVSWYACSQPAYMPKDELIALTGGYRRIPVLQIGADLYFDTGLIIAELDRRFPEPSVLSGSGPGIGIGLSHWTDAVLMSIAGLLYGGDRDSSPDYRADRSALLGVNFDVEAMERAWTVNSEKLRFHLALLEQQLADGRVFLTGGAPDLIDASFYALVEYMHCGKGKTAALLNDFPGIAPWAERMRLIGIGKCEDISREETIRIARTSMLAPVLEQSIRLPHEPAPGDRVSIKYYDANSPVLHGTLQHISPLKLSILRDDEGGGPVMLHMPRSLGQVAPNTN